MLLLPATKLGLGEARGSSHGPWKVAQPLNPTTKSVALTLTQGCLWACMTSYEEGS